MPSGYPFPRSVRWEFFDRVCRGQPVTQAARDLGVFRNTAWKWWGDASGMKLVKGRHAAGLAEPGDLDRPGGRGHRLSLDERIEIMRGRDAELSYAEIGRRIGRDRSVVLREIRRNCNPDRDYHARLAHARAAGKACRPKAFKLVDHPLSKAIEDWMGDGWSPKLIADVLACDYPDDRLMRVSHETIYQCLYVQTRGSLRADLYKCLSTKRAARKHRGRATSHGVYTPGRSSPSASVPPRPPTALCPATGKAI